KMMQLKEEKLLVKAKTKRIRRDPTPEVIFDEDDKQQNLKDMIFEHQCKVGKDSGLVIAETPTPFNHSLEDIPNIMTMKSSRLI
ncbi:MAG: hypothetical protein Q8829_02750, partial [Candidatus Phytoplasma australasiaticum]|nr:hypothetical protein [Candidatus Phytoplasma australasiaticum]